jgi:hypothetical protein
MNLNYKSLTDLSETSRRDALQSMSQLYQRLSYSQLQIHPALRSKNPQYCESSDNNSNSSKDKKKSTSSRHRSSGPHVTRMPIKSSSQPQLVVVRSKNTSSRKGSTSNSSASSSKPNSKSASPYDSPLASPVPENAVLDPYVMQKTDYTKGPYSYGTIAPNTGRKRVDSFDAVHPTARPPVYIQPYDYFNFMPEHIQQPTPKLPDFTPTSRKTPAPPVPWKPTSLSNKASLSPVSAPVKRRLDKMTPSSYTFASDSTKLGEIPQRNWANPWDYEEAERLNRVAAAAPVAGPVVEEKVKVKKGLRFWRRGSGGEVA